MSFVPSNPSFLILQGKPSASYIGCGGVGRGCGQPLADKGSNSDCLAQFFYFVGPDKARTLLEYSNGFMIASIQEEPSMPAHPV